MIAKYHFYQTAMTRGMEKPAFIAHFINFAAALMSFALNKLSPRESKFSNPNGVICEKVDDLAEMQEAADQDARRNQLRFRDLIKVGFKTRYKI